jgi:hypothetical protein
MKLRIKYTRSEDSQTTRPIKLIQWIHMEKIHLVTILKASLFKLTS